MLPGFRSFLRGSYAIHLPQKPSPTIFSALCCYSWSLGGPGWRTKIAQNGKREVGLLKVLPEPANPGALGSQRSPSPGDAGSRTLTRSLPRQEPAHALPSLSPVGCHEQSARWPTTQRKARRSSPRATLQHDTANKGVFLSCLGAGTQLLPFKGSDYLQQRQPDQRSTFALLCEPSLDVIASSEPFVHLYLSWDPPRLFNFRAKSRLIQQR